MSAFYNYDPYVSWQKDLHYFLQSRKYPGFPSLTLHPISTLFHVYLQHPRQSQYQLIPWASFESFECLPASFRTSSLASFCHRHCWFYLFLPRKRSIPWLRCCLYRSHHRCWKVGRHLDLAACCPPCNCQNTASGLSEGFPSAGCSIQSGILPYPEGLLHAHLPHQL